MGAKYYKKLNDLNEIDEVLTLTDKVLATQHVVIKDPSSAPKIVAASLTAVAGTGALVAGTGAAGVAGAGIAGAGIAGGLGAGAMGAAGVAGGIALAPIAVPLALVTGIGYLIFKSKKEKQLREALQFRLKKAVEKENQLIRTYEAILKKQQEAANKKIAEQNDTIIERGKKIDELFALNKSLRELIQKMTDQLAAA